MIPFIQNIQIRYIYRNRRLVVARGWVFGGGSDGEQQLNQYRV
jgi:hypothetical protein